MNYTNVPDVIINGHLEKMVSQRLALDANHTSGTEKQKKPTMLKRLKLFVHKIEARFGRRCHFCLTKLERMKYRNRPDLCWKCWTESSIETKSQYI